MFEEGFHSLFLGVFIDLYFQDAFLQLKIFMFFPPIRLHRHSSSLDSPFRLDTNALTPQSIADANDA